MFEAEVCIFCHAPHNNSGQKPLWNRLQPPAHYRIYESSTLDARVDQPSGPSKMCLSCHDGALAIGLVASSPDPIPVSRTTLPPGSSDLTQDLSNDHPIGFRYDRALASRDRQLRSPDVVSDLLPLGKHSELHCTTCHDPHNNELGDFLRVPSLRSAICTSCHDMTGWNACSHATSPERVSGRSVDPGEPLPFSTVADNGCVSCHQVHGAGASERLLRFRREEDNCLNCHNGGIAALNIENEFRKPSAHPIARFTERHDPEEDPRTQRRHVECADCHNPHAVAPDVSVTPAFASTQPGLVQNSMQFVSGLDRFGHATPYARYEYEVCFKCHADGVSRAARANTVRDVLQTNTRMEFQPSNPSFHPVLGARNNNDVVSLLSPWRVGSVLRCTDCHNSDQVDAANSYAPAGPHGSIYEPLLAANYEQGEFVTESARAYALCYRCHDRRSILNDESFPLHGEHIIRGRASCSACHDAHGISRSQGDARNHSNLINFDLTQVQPASGGAGARIQFIDQGRYAGSCTLVCHGVTHVAFEYGR